MNSASSFSSAARFLHSFLCSGRCAIWQIALQYLTILQPLQILRPSSPPLPQAAHVDLFWVLMSPRLAINQDHCTTDFRSGKADLKQKIDNRIVRGVKTIRSNAFSESEFPKLFRIKRANISQMIGRVKFFGTSTLSVLLWMAITSSMNKFNARATNSNFNIS